MRRCGGHQRLLWSTEQMTKFISFPTACGSELSEQPGPRGSQSVEARPLHLGLALEDARGCHWRHSAMLVGVTVPLPQSLSPNQGWLTSQKTHPALHRCSTGLLLLQQGRRDNPAWGTDQNKAGYLSWNFLWK